MSDYRSWWRKPPATGARATRRNNGLCLDCGQPAEQGKSRCAKHLEANAARARERREYLHSIGLCITCGKIAAFEDAKCPTCLARAKATNRRWRNRESA